LLGKKFAKKGRKLVSKRFPKRNLHTVKKGEKGEGWEKRHSSEGAMGKQPKKTKT